MIEGWAIYPSHQKSVSNAFEWMIESAAKNGISLTLRFADRISITIGDKLTKILYDGEECALPHFVLMRHYDHNLSTIFENMGIRVFNTTSSMMLSQNKLLTHLALQKCNIKTIFTLYGVSDYDECVNKLGLPFVMKAIIGSKGEDVHLIENESSFENKKEDITLYGGAIIAQRYISSSYGRDLRLWVVGGNVVASVLRWNDKSFKSNISLGGLAKNVDVSNEVKLLAIGSCKSIGLELAGVDILFDGDEYTVCEVNGNAGFRAFGMSGDDSDIPHEIFKYVRTCFT